MLYFIYIKTTKYKTAIFLLDNKTPANRDLIYFISMCPSIRNSVSPPMRT